MLAAVSDVNVYFGFNQSPSQSFGVAGESIFTETTARQVNTNEASAYMSR